MARPDRLTTRSAVLLCLLLILPPATWSVAAAAPGETENESTAEATHESHGGHDLEFRHVVGLFLGFTDEEGHDPEFTQGLEYYYRVAPRWSVGVAVEYAGGDVRDRVVAVPVYWFPHAGWLFLAGPGIEYHKGREATPPGVDEDERAFLFKIGVGYEFELGKHFLLEPSYSLDFVEGEQISVYGVSFGVQF